MKNVFIDSDRSEILDRLEALRPDSARQWGKMNAAQMLAHCAAVLECATGERPRKQIFLGKIFAPLVRRSALGEKPFGKGSPTGPEFVMADERDFEAEKARLAGALRRLYDQGRESAARYTHPFFGRLSGDQWGVLTYKHLDHHLRQFGA